MAQTTIPDAPPRPPRRRRGRRWFLILLALVPVFAVVGGVVLWLGSTPDRQMVRVTRPSAADFTIPYLDVASGSAIPVAPRALPTQQWITRVSARTDIPSRVLQAYVLAATITAQRIPACGITWATLAGVGRVESDHGQHHGDTVGASGEEATPIVGPALDGSPGVQRIPDTDHGVLDGDPTWDRAVGPMQFLPSRWRQLGVRASGDGRPADPQNIDDAALTAAEYLCDNGRLASPAGWWTAMFHYNNSVAYGREVFSAANAYATTANKLR